MATAKERQDAIDLLVAEGVIQPIEDGEEPTVAQQDKAMAVDNWINDLGGHDDAAIVVYEMDPKTNKPVYIESLGVQEMDGPMLFEKLKNEYGGGKFRIQMRADGAIRKTQTVEIKKTDPKTDANGSAFGGTDLPALVRELKSEGNSNIELIMSMMQQSNQQFQQMITTIVGAMGSNNNQPVVDPMAMQASLLDGIQTMQKLAGVNKADKNPTDLILEGVKLVGAIKETGEGGEANMYSLLSKAIGEFGGVIGQGMAMPQIPGAPAQPAPQPAQITDASTASNPAEETPPEPALGTPTLPEGHPLAAFEPFVDWMLSLAHKNANPELYAEVIIDQIGPEQAYAWLATEEGISALRDNLPKVAPYENWIRLVGREIAELTAVDPNAEGAQTPGEAESNQDVDALAGQPAAEPNPTYIDGDTERPGGDQENITIDGEVSESSEDDATNP